MANLIAVPRPEVIPLSSGYLDPDLQPTEALGAALSRAARRPASWGRVPAEGKEELRAWFAKEAGGELRAGDMTVCAGAQEALATVFRGLGERGDAALVESPTYLGAIAAARDAGMKVVPVPADEDGVRPDLLSAAFERTGAKLFYCQPLHANPHGAVLSEARRAEVMDIVRSSGRVPGRGRLGARLHHRRHRAADAGLAGHRRPRRVRALADQGRRAGAARRRRSVPAGLRAPG